MNVEDKKLTDRQLDTYIFICDYIKAHGYAPSLREIANGIFVSKPVAQKHLIALIDKGFIRYTPRTARSIVLNVNVS